MNKEQILNLVGNFIWFWSSPFFVETEIGNFIWQNPEYNGDNTFTSINLSMEEFCKKYSYPYGRDKGKHVIKNYCGEDIKIIFNGKEII